MRCIEQLEQWTLQAWGGEGRAHSSGSNLKVDTWFSFSSLMTCYIQGIETQYGMTLSQGICGK